MKTSSKTLTGTIALGAAATFVGACGSSEAGGDGDAFLSIVGDQNVYLEGGEQADLEVRYHDRDDQPLQGSVEFAIDGDAYGAQLTSPSATTNEDGVASVTLDATNDDQASFYVEASAPGAGTVTWNVTLEEDSGPADPNGSYRVDSSLDLVTNLEGDVGDITNDVLDFTTDPGTFILLEIADATEGDLISKEQAEQFGGTLTTLLEQQAPELVGDLLDLGDLLDDNLKNFGVVSEMTISGSGEARSADHKITGIAFRYEGQTETVTMDDIGQDPIEVTDVGLSFDADNNALVVDAHTLPMSYGALLAVGIENVLIPVIDSSADDFADFLETHVPCDTLADLVIEEFDFLNEEDHKDTLVDGCEIGVVALADQIMNQIESIDETGLALEVGGESEAQDADGNGEADALVNGAWEGSIDYGGAAAATLDPSDNSFSGERLGE